MIPPISIVTPSYQQGRFIERTILSVLGQNIDSLEHLVFYGGSRDETVEILRRYEDRLHWVSERDRGQTDAVNKGIRQSTAQIIGWLNSDDVYYPGALARVLEAFEQHPEADVIYGKAHHIDIDDGVIEEYPTEPWDPDRLRNVCFICQPALFFRRSVVERFGELDESFDYCMDYEYWIRLSQGGARFYYLEEFLAGSRLYADTKTLGSRVKVHAQINDMLKYRLGEVPIPWIFNYAHAVVDQRGVPRTHRFAYSWQVAFASWAASLRWSGNVPAEVRRTTWKWVRDNSLGAIHWRGGRDSR